jgi:hypothetical protein
LTIARLLFLSHNCTTFHASIDCEQYFKNSNCNNGQLEIKDRTNKAEVPAKLLAFLARDEFMNKLEYFGSNPVELFKELWQGQNQPCDLIIRELSQSCGNSRSKILRNACKDNCCIK